ncbi:DNA repair protein RecN [Atopobium sp. oral taxon 810]|uniref:DNA repair protein RecN n=1 Tax=Atopobium sp. oral taxon 810 TaxID=712158 RepID=UPI0003960522|nr:DNA repair protein RecN [Atopobium sp. oral taxon 810]ERI03965.1 DNA repair protein RecN [Atopobium sp. oral taxon 810 str. F0209]
MIDELRARDVALIKDATINPAATGLTVLTGETGTGKSALLSSIKLLMGERADAGAVREGADALVVEARLFLADGDPDGMIVRRRVEAGGRGRVDIDGHMASVRELAEQVGSSIDLCGQHEHQRLISQSSHAAMLDGWIGNAAYEARDAYGEALAHARAVSRELERVREDGRNATERLDEAQFTLNRINAVDPHEGEYEELEEQLPRFEHAEALMGAASTAHRALTGDNGAEDQLSDAISNLREGARYDKQLAQLADTLENALIEIEDASRELRDYRDSVDFNPVELDQMQSRMASLRGLMRSYGPGIQDVLERRERASRIVAAAADGGEALRRAEAALAAAEATLAQKADALDALRQEAGPRFAREVSEQMTFLQMGSASIELAVERLPRSQWSSEGPSRVTLMYRPAAGLTARPLRRIASGGEVSRVMLAIKVVQGETDVSDTLVFDEVDAGVGGATAVALAQMLARLGKSHQVIVVTHLAQVAVLATRHYLVSKSDGNVPETTIEQITGEERVYEIARMLSGDETAASLAHAREMLEEAAR